MEELEWAVEVLSSKAFYIVIKAFGHMVGVKCGISWGQWATDMMSRPPGCIIWKKTSKEVRKGFLFALSFWFMVGDNRSDGFSYNR